MVKATEMPRKKPVMALLLLLAFTILFFVRTKSIVPGKTKIIIKKIKLMLIIILKKSSVIKQTVAPNIAVEQRQHKMNFFPLIVGAEDGFLLHKGLSLNVFIG